MFEDWRFRRSLRKLKDAGVQGLGDYAAAVWPCRSVPVRNAGFVALDFELDGLGRDAHLLEAGWVPFDARRVPLGAARSLDIRSDRTLNDKAVTLHGIGEERARKGTALDQVLSELLAVLGGQIVIAHGASIERHALRRATKAVFGHAIPVRSICTLALERQLHPSLSGSEPYRLGSARSRYNLPPHDLHSALGDAVATAELFLAQLSRLPADTPLGRLEALRVDH